MRRQRVDQHTGRITARTTTVRKKLFAANRGFVTVNDGPATASQLARYLSAISGRAGQTGGEQRRRVAATADLVRVSGHDGGTV